jgi:hypothetical protein
MRKVALVFTLFALSLPIYARNPSRLSRMTAVDPATLVITPVSGDLPARLLAEWKAGVVAHRTASRTGVHASALVDSVSTRALVIPAAGSIAGGGGTFFRSDVTLVNYGATPEQVLAGLWVQGTTNSLNPANYKTITLQPNSFVTVQDFVVNGLGLSNTLGTLLFIPYTGTDIDQNGAIDGFSRIYTNQPGSTGTVSQPFDAVDPDFFSAQLVDEGISLGLRQDAGFRTNFGIVNVDSSDHVFKVTFIGEKMTNSLTLTVKAFGMIQQAVPAGDYGALQIDFAVTDDTGANLVTWVGYASSTDNITGDGWVSLASANLTPDDLTTIGY